MTIREDMEQRIREHRADGTVSGRMLAIVTEQAMASMDEETLNRKLEEE